MATRHFMELLRARWAQGKYVCVGLDSDFNRVRPLFPMGPTEDIMSAFNRRIVKTTGHLVCAFKPNIAFYESLGHVGLTVLHRTIILIRKEFPEVPIILDTKRADIGKTNMAYVQALFDNLGADAITVNPYLGGEALRPFLDREEKGIIVLCRTSNPGAGEFQDLRIDSDPLYLHVARAVAERWNRHGNCAIVVGATYPAELARVRQVVPDLPLLIPGIGTQGGDIEATVRAAHHNMIINSSSGIIFSSDPRAATQQLDDQIRHTLAEVS